MAEEMPVGARLGSERLFTEEPFVGERITPLLFERPLGVPPDMPREWDRPPEGEHSNLAPGFEIFGEGEQGPSRELEKPRRRRRPKRRVRSLKRRRPPPQPRPERPVAARTADVNWRDLGSTGLELAGITAITAGSWLIAAWLGLIVLGLCLILLGIATGLPRNP